jgi:hypothetical protein
MNDKRRLIIIIGSVTIGTLLSALLFMAKGGGKLTDRDYSNLFTNLIFALAIVVFIGIIFKPKKKDKS